MLLLSGMKDVVSHGQVLLCERLLILIDDRFLLGLLLLSFHLNDSVPQQSYGDGELN